ncbi:MAG: hypothetical protein KHY76_01360 [Butyricicoccus pullicaecorum]|nr:hypothetical protein [Butyricicoccus pullicaecorum]
MDRKETTGLNPMLSLKQQIEEKSEGLCNIGPGPGGIGASSPRESEIYMSLMFEPEPVQDGVVFPESVEGYFVRTAGFDTETDRELTKEELEKLLKESQNPTTQKIAGTILALSEPQYISTEECVNAFGVMAEEAMREVCEEPQNGMNGPMM